MADDYDQAQGDRPASLLNDPLVREILTEDGDLSPHPVVSALIAEAKATGEPLPELPPVLTLADLVLPSPGRHASRLADLARFRAALGPGPSDDE